MTHYDHLEMTYPRREQIINFMVQKGTVPCQVDDSHVHNNILS